MKSEFKILSTKKLNNDQKEIFINSGFSLLDEDFISVESLSFQIENQPTLLLFTSQNAVVSVVKNEKVEDLKKVPAICVGMKTKNLLEKNSFQVLDCENYAEDLALILPTKYKESKIAFFAGNFRRNVLPEAMKNLGIEFEEFEVYKNTLQPIKIDEKVDGILFFSPSGVESYLKNNSISNEICFCIGTTTAASLQGITENIVIADEQTVDNVIEQTIKYFRRKS